MAAPGPPETCWHSRPGGDAGSKPQPRAGWKGAGESHRPESSDLVVGGTLMCRQPEGVVVKGPNGVGGGVGDGAGCGGWVGFDARGVWLEGVTRGGWWRGCTCPCRQGVYGTSTGGRGRGGERAGDLRCGWREGVTAKQVECSSVIKGVKASLQMRAGLTFRGSDARRCVRARCAGA